MVMALTKSWRMKVPSVLFRLQRHKAGVSLALLSLGMSAYLLTIFVKWAVFHSVLHAGSRAACIRASIDGACWASIVEWNNALVFGFYPRPGTWRPGAVVIFALAAAVTFTLGRSPVVRVSTFGSMLFLPAIAVRLAGGSDAIPTRLLFVAGMAMLLLGVTGALWRKPIARSRYRLIGSFAAVAAAMALDISLPESAFVTTQKWGGGALTVCMAVLCVAYGFPLGILLALARRSEYVWISRISVAIIEGTRSLPLVFVLLVFSVFLPQFFRSLNGVDLLTRASVALSLFSSVYFAEIIRAGLAAVDDGQFEAAAALSLGYWETLLLIALPQALRTMLPSIIALIANIVKDTALVSVIGLFDLLNVVRSISQDPHWLGTVWEPLITAAVFYFSVCFTLSSLARRLASRKGDQKH